jgi:hypothetical protein
MGFLVRIDFKTNYHATAHTTINLEPPNQTTTRASKTQTSSFKIVLKLEIESLAGQTQNRTPLSPNV